MIIRVLKMLKSLNPKYFLTKILMSNVLFKGAKNGDNVSDEA